MEFTLKGCYYPDAAQPELIDHDSHQFNTRMYYVAWRLNFSAPIPMGILFFTSSIEACEAIVLRTTGRGISFVPLPCQPLVVKTLPIPTRM